VNHPYRAGPFYLLLPLNPAGDGDSQSRRLAEPARVAKACPADDDAIDRAAAMIAKSGKVAIKAGVGRAVTMPLSGGSRKLPAPLWCCHPARLACSRTRTRKNMHVGGSKARSAAILPWPKPNF
jgi:3D-(3,5/4)-trihydroxycyclohexane-1,2-dione acylhydrolase (decyclizing)